MTELEEKIKNFADNYYQGNELISDEDYDLLIAKLKTEQPDSELLKGPIGSDIKGVTQKIKLPITMGTLDKCNSEEEMNAWWDKHSHNDILAELKIDGNGQCLVYKSGEICQTISRGDGEYGEDTTTNISKIPNVLHTLNTPFNGKIRGEVAMLRSTFNKHFPDGKNPRNQCAGIVKRLDGKDMDKLVFIAYDVFDDDNIVDKTEVDKLQFLMDNGFQVPEWRANPSLEELIEWKNNLDPNGEIPCDGIVIKQNKVDKNDLMRHTPLNNVAFKPNLQSARTVVNKIDWQICGRYLAPVAYVKPVELEGTTVEKASLANVNIMNSLGIYEGAEVIISKHGLIIPQVDLVINPKKNAFAVPTICPVCGGPIVVNDSGVPECVTETCPRKVGHRFKKMFKVFGIKGAGDSFVSKLEDAGITIEDFLEMCKNDDKKVLNKYAGGVNGEKVYTQMRDVMGKQISAAKFLAIFDEPMLDEKRFLLFGNKTLDDLMFLSCKAKEEITSFKGIGEEIADAYINFFNKNKEEIIALRQYFTFESIYVTIEEENNSGGKKMSKISGKSFCFTGKACLPRKDLQAMVFQNGGINKDSVVKGLDYLVTDDTESGSAKNKKAKELGIPILTSKEFMNLLS